MMHLRNSQPTVRSSGRLAQFKPNSVPKIKPLPTVWNRASSRTNGNTKRSKSLDSRPKSAPQPKKVVHFANGQTDQIDDPQEESVEQYLISRKPSAIYRYNSVQFLNSLRNFRQNTAFSHKSELSRHYRMSKDILDSFVRLKSAQFDSLFGERAKPLNGFSESPNLKKDSPSAIITESSITSDVNAELPSTTNQIKELSPKKKQTTPTTTPMFRKKNIVRPKSASIHSRRSRLLSSATSSKSASKLTNGSDEEQLNGVNGVEDDDENDVEPFFHRSLDKISSIANWERQIRYELEIEKELQRRELDRQKEKIQSDQRKLEEWDKHLRIELDARERKIRLSEEELRSRYEEFSQKSSELMRREQMINDIVTERIKAEMKFEIEKLRKKFNELELDKSNLTKKEERVKEVETRLHEQVKIVKEKIDSKRLSDIELAKYKKELEIVRKENEVFKEKVDSMEDYQVAKYENRSMKSELLMLKETLESKNQELERDRDRWEKEQRACDQKVISLRGELRKAEQDLVIQKQKAQGDLDEMNSKYDAVNGQLKRLQAFIKDHLAKLNSDFSSAAHSLNAATATQHSFLGNKMPMSHLRHHSSSHHLHRLNRNGHGHNSKGYQHQRSVSMDGHDYISSRNNKSCTSLLRSPVRGCRLCNDDEDCEVDDEVIDEDEYILDASHGRNNALIDCGDIDEEDTHKKGTTEEEYAHLTKHDHETLTSNNESGTKQNSNEDEVVQKIVNKIYEKMSNQVQNMTSRNDVPEEGMPNGKLNNDSLLMSRLLSSMSDHEPTAETTTNKVIGPKTNATNVSSGSVIRELINSNQAQSTSAFPLTTTITPSQVNRENKPPTRGLKSILNDDFDADTNEELPNYQQSANRLQQHRSLYEELLASESVAGSSSNVPTNGIHKTNVPFSSEINSPIHSALSNQLGSSPVVHSIQNDNNNNHVLSKNPPNEPITTASRTSAPTGPKESQETRSSSSGGSRSDSKSESFEIDW